MKKRIKINLSNLKEGDVLEFQSDNTFTNKPNGTGGSTTIKAGSEIDVKKTNDEYEIGIKEAFKLEVEANTLGITTLTQSIADNKKNSLANLEKEFSKPIKDKQLLEFNIDGTHKFIDNSSGNINIPVNYKWINDKENWTSTGSSLERTSPLSDDCYGLYFSMKNVDIDINGYVPFIKGIQTELPNSWNNGVGGKFLFSYIGKISVFDKQARPKTINIDDVVNLYISVPSETPIPTLENDIIVKRDATSETEKGIIKDGQMTIDLSNFPKLVAPGVGGVRTANMGTGSSYYRVLGDVYNDFFKKIIIPNDPDTTADYNSIADYVSLRKAFELGYKDNSNNNDFSLDNHNQIFLYWEHQGQNATPRVSKIPGISTSYAGGSSGTQFVFYITLPLTWEYFPKGSDILVPIKGASAKLIFSLQFPQNSTQARLYMIRLEADGETWTTQNLNSTWINSKFSLGFIIRSNN